MTFIGFKFMLIFLISSNCFFHWSSIAFNCFSFLTSIFFSLLNNPSFWSSLLSKPLVKLPSGDYSNLACSTVLRLRPKSSPVKYSYLCKLLEDNADVLAAFLSKSYCASFFIIFLRKILIWSVTVISIRNQIIFF